MVIPEADLFALGEPAAGGRPVAPVEGVIARGGRLRRRRRAVRALGVTAVVGSMAAAGTLVAARGNGGRGELQTAQTTETTASPPPALYPNPMSCLDAEVLERSDFVGPTTIPRADVPDDMRVIPTVLPDDAPPISVARGSYYDLEPSDCGPVAAYDDTLKLTADGPDGVAAVLRVAGPYSTPSGSLGLSYAVESTLRGQPATMAVNGVSEFVIFTWTEPDGGSWEIRAEGMDEAGVRAVAEALQLDSSPQPGQPPAQIPPESLPAGYRVASQAPTVPGPAPEVADEMTWVVQVGESGDPSTGFMCQLDVRRRPGMGEIDESSTGFGDQRVTVAGRDALWGPLMGVNPASRPPGVPAKDLTWGLSEDTVAHLACGYWDGPNPGTLPLDRMIEIAESLQPVAPDDPRLPPE
ncbi:MAG TPA: hypothetical protein VFB77_05030 [Acidimicrobiales bacterium]|nr:hypothetical protein [Acidimicrobiales bacterium]